MTRKRQRLWIVLACGLGIGSATALALSAFSGNLVFFLTPSDLAARPAAPDQIFRLGGLVQQGSVQEAVLDGSPDTQFRVTDGKASVEVTYIGILPDLFREGQGVVAIGRLMPGGAFRASEVLAKHDAAYMPKSVASSLERRGLWNPASGSPPPASTWNDLTMSTAAKMQPGS